MAQNGVKTTNLVTSPTLDALIGNHAGTTKQMLVPDLAHQLRAEGAFATVPLRASFTTLQSLNDDTDLTYAINQPGSVVAGDLVSVGYYNLEVADAAALDQHYTTAGGVKLYEAGSRYTTLARLQAAVTRGSTWRDGDLVSAGGKLYVADTSLSAIDGLGGLVPDGRVTPQHFGAKADGVSDATAAIQSAITFGANNKLPVKIPAGTYKTTAPLVLPANATLIGDGRNVSIISGTSKGHPVLEFNGSGIEVSGLYLRDGSVGVKNKTGNSNSSKITDCNVKYNRIGVELSDAYILLIKNNNISFNDYGIISGSQSYQVVVRDNIIDNNLQGCGILAFSSTGMIIDGNTVEGNRNNDVPATTNGFGIWVVGANQRCVIANNWFEANGNQSGSADIIIGRPSEVWVDDLAANSVPAEYAGEVVNGKTITGGVTVDGNFFYSTKRGIAAKLNWAAHGSMSICNNTFVGVLGVNNRPVDLFGASGYAVIIERNRITNTANAAVTAEMLAGIRGSYVYHTGTVPDYNMVKLDGSDLFTASLTQTEFLALTGATMDARSRRPTSGTAVLKNGITGAVGGNGVRIVEETGKPRAGATGILSTSGNTYYAVLIASGAAAGFLYQHGSGWSELAANDGSGGHLIHKINPINAEAYLHSGDYYGWVVMTEADFIAAGLSGCQRLEITDMAITDRPMTAATSPDSWSGSANYSWAVGDVVYNTAPASGGSIGWVCVTAGNPGTWTTFGSVT